MTAERINHHIAMSDAALAVEIERLSQDRAFNNWLGRRKKVVQIDTMLGPLKLEQLRRENLTEQIRRDIEWIGNGERDKRRVA